MAAPVLPADNKAGGPVFTHQAQSDPHRGVALLLDGVRRLFLHADDLAGMHDLDRQLLGGRMRGHLGANHVFLAHQQYADAVVPGGQNGALNLGLRSPVGAHCIDRNC